MLGSPNDIPVPEMRVESGFQWDLNLPFETVSVLAIFRANSVNVLKICIQF